MARLPSRVRAAASATPRRIELNAPLKVRVQPIAGDGRVPKLRVHKQGFVLTSKLLVDGGHVCLTALLRALPLFADTASISPSDVVRPNES